MVSLFLVNCEGELLNISPVSTISTSTFYKQPSDFEEALIGIYDAFQGFADNEYLRFTELRSDNSDGVEQASFVDISRDASSLNTGVTNGLWHRLYSFINLSNAILDRIDDVPFINESRKNSIKGQGLFFRGLGHYYVGKFFGEGVVLTSQIEITEAQNITSLVNQDALFSQAESDFSEAIDVLSVTVGFGEVSKYVAEGFLADYYMFTGQPNKAMPLLESVLQESDASWEPIFENIHATDQNQEVIFAAAFAGGIDIATSYPQWAVTTDGLLVDGFTTYTDDLLNHFEDGDLRRLATLEVGEWTSPISGITFAAAQNEVRNVKLENGNNGNNQGTGDIIFIRYTDMLLYYAEALENNTGINGWTARSIVNQVRERAGLPLLSEVNVDDILQERRSEFVWEGQRWWDQVRTNNTAGIEATYEVPEIELARMGL
ncbi:hypothetical protein LCGC14_1038990 [marine sediment metagenome]